MGKSELLFHRPGRIFGGQTENHIFVPSLWVLIETNMVRVPWLKIKEATIPW